MFNHSEKIGEITVGCLDIWHEPIIQREENISLETGSLATQVTADNIWVIGCLTALKPTDLMGVRTTNLHIMYHDRITRIHRLQFQGLVSAENLFLDHNSIETIESDSFDDDPFKFLVTLSLKHNKIICRFFVRSASNF